MSLHFGLTRKYTLALLNLFNDLEVQYLNSDGVTSTTKRIPCKYSSREKATIFDEYTAEQLLSGNYNVLPRASLSLDGLTKSVERTTNKFNKINVHTTDNTKEFTYNAVAYDFSYSLIIQCRGMNEAGMIIEQIAPKFNPIITLRINEVPNQPEATSVPVLLEGIEFEQSEYDEISSNIVTITVTLLVKGQLYPPVKSIEKIKYLKMNLNEQIDNFYNRKSILGWDVVDNEVINPELYIFNPSALIINDILVEDSLTEGNFNLTVSYEYNGTSNLTYTWDVTSGVATIVGNGDTVLLVVTEYSFIEVQCEIVDKIGNISSITKLINYNIQDTSSLPAELDLNLTTLTIDLDNPTTDPIDLNI